MPQIISTDTTWKTGQIITLTETVEVASGVTLTIEPGVVVRGESIHAFGTVLALGTSANTVRFEGVRFEFGDKTQAPGTFNLDFTDLIACSFFPPYSGGNFMYGTVAITNSLIERDHSAWYLNFWQNGSGSRLERNVVLDVDQLAVRSHSNFSIVENTFVDSSAGQSGVSQWDGLGTTSSLIRAVEGTGLTVQGNTFLVAGRPALENSSFLSTAAMNAPGNYFGTNDPALIALLILDKQDSLNRAALPISPVLSSPDADAPYWGTSRPDIWSGSSASNRAWGNDGNDSFRGSGGDDRIEGGAGIDTSAYSGPRGGYTILARGNQAQIVDTTADDGADTLVDVERLTFTDTSIALNLGGAAGTAAKILGATFGAAAVHNSVYVGIGLSLLDSGASLSEVAGLAVREALRGDVSHESVVNLLYTNVVGSAPPAGDRGYFVNLLDSGQYSVEGLTILAAETGLNLANIDFAGLAQRGIEYTPY